MGMLRVALLAVAAVRVARGFLRPPNEPDAKMPADAPTLFFLGPGSTGSRAMADLFQAMLPLAGACHDQCIPAWPVGSKRPDDRDLNRWDLATRRRDAAFFRTLRRENHTVAYLDHGQLAAWKWVERTVAPARFVLMTRGLAAWALSRIPHVCDAAEIAGRTDGCVASLAYAVVQAADHQACVRAYFGTKARRPRFVTIDVCDEPLAAARAKLAWLLADPERKARAPPNASDYADPPPDPDAAPAGSHDHGADERWLVDRVLAPCGAAARASPDYAACAAAVRRRLFDGAGSRAARTKLASRLAKTCES